MTKYISKDGLEKLRVELKELETVKRKEIAKRIEEAKSFGDLSENADYLEARESQSFNEGRIRELEETIKNAVIIEEGKVAGTTVEVGDTVEVQNEKGQKITYTIVGSDEADPVKNKISNESPLGKAFLFRTPGESVEVVTPMGKSRYKVLNIK